MTDDMGYGDLSGYGHKEYSTPNLDKLASQGMKFINAYAGAPVCTPTRTSFITGRYPARTPVGLIEPLTAVGDSATGLTTKYPSIGTLMKASGYHTALIGKWHLGVLPEHYPTRNGFDYFYGNLTGAVDYVSHKTHSLSRTDDLYEMDKPIQQDGYYTDLITDKTIAYLRQKHVNPFFLVVMYTAPHWPWQAPGDLAYPDTVDFTRGGSVNTYAAMMKNLDDGIGKIMEVIDKQKLSANTVVIFTNDNGGERYSDNGGLSRSKMNLWEGGIRVPAFVRWPGKIKPGTTTNQVAITMDWTATILALAGGKADKKFPLDGINLVPMLTGRQSNTVRTLYWRTFQRTKQKALRSGNWKYLQDEKGEYLFDLGKDQKEQNDLKEKFPAIFNGLKNRYAAWEKMVLAPVPLQRN
jgi:arylsulfatase A-like enzyme